MKQILICLFYILKNSVFLSVNYQLFNSPSLFKSHLKIVCVLINIQSLQNDCGLIYKYVLQTSPQNNGLQLHHARHCCCSFCGNQFFRGWSCQTSYQKKKKRLENPVGSYLNPQLVGNKTESYFPKSICVEVNTVTLAEIQTKCANSHFPH